MVDLAEVCFEPSSSSSSSSSSGETLSFTVTVISAFWGDGGEDTAGDTVADITGGDARQAFSSASSNTLYSYSQSQSHH